jgi:hypothetical protein
MARESSPVITAVAFNESGETLQGPFGRPGTLSRADRHRFTTIAVGWIPKRSIARVGATCWMPSAGC